jgi:hypothetical protein
VGGQRRALNLPSPSTCSPVLHMHTWTPGHLDTCTPVNLHTCKPVGTTPPPAVRRSRRRGFKIDHKTVFGATFLGAAQPNIMKGFWSKLAAQFPQAFWTLEVSWIPPEPSTDVICGDLIRLISTRVPAHVRTCTRVYLHTCKPVDTTSPPAFRRSRGPGPRPRSVFLRRS